jgi:hypothetical protein
MQTIHLMNNSKKFIDRGYGCSNHLKNLNSGNKMDFSDYIYMGLEETGKMSPYLPYLNAGVAVIFFD